MPRSLDRFEEANAVLAEMTRQNNELAARHSASLVAEKAQLRVQAFKRAGLRELDETPQPTGEKYRTQPIYETTDGRSWLLLDIGHAMSGTTQGPVGRHPEYVTYADFEIEGIKFTDALQWNQVTVTELAAMRTRAEKDEADDAEVKAAREAAQKILAKAPRVPWTTETNIHMGRNEVTLDLVEALVAATNAKVVPVGTEGLLVSAAREAELVAMVPATAPKFTAKQFRGHDARVAQLVHCLSELGPLAVSWARLDGKKPAADDDGKLLANRLGPNKIFVH